MGPPPGREECEPRQFVGARSAARLMRKGGLGLRPSPGR